MFIEVSAILSIIWLALIGHYLRPVYVMIQARKGK